MVVVDAGTDHSTYDASHPDEKSKVSLTAVGVQMSCRNDVIFLHENNHT